MFDILDADVFIREKRPIVVTFPGPERGTALCALYEHEPLAPLTPSRNSKELFWQRGLVEIATIFLLG
jgi:hypothetical protein